jgi:hypothetical protein
MTGKEYRKALDNLKLSQMDASRVLRVNGRTVRRWIADEVPIPHSVVLVLLLMQKYELGPDQIAELMPKKKKRAAKGTPGRPSLPTAV